MILHQERPYRLPAMTFWFAGIMLYQVLLYIAEGTIKAFSSANLVQNS